MTLALKLDSLLRMTQEEMDIIVDIKRDYRGDIREFFKLKLALKAFFKLRSRSRSGESQVRVRKDSLLKHSR